VGFFHTQRAVVLEFVRDR